MVRRKMGLQSTWLRARSGLPLSNTLCHGFDRGDDPVQVSGELANGGLGGCKRGFRGIRQYFVFFGGFRRVWGVWRFRGV